MKEQEKIELIKDLISYDELYIIEDLDGNVKAKSESLETNNITNVSQDLNLANHDIAQVGGKYQIGKEICKIGDKYYVSSISESNSLVVKRYKDVTEIINQIIKLEKLGYKDKLTGLFNYQYFKKEIDNFIKKNKGKVCICMVDIDDFKNINDNYGHHFGNKTLISFAKNMQKFFSNEQLVCKFGGDEFIIALGEKDIKQVSKELKEFKKIVSQANIGLSIGISEWDENILKKKSNNDFTATDLERMQTEEGKRTVIAKYNISNADTAMYYSKKINAKNCVTIYNKKIREELENKNIINRDEKQEDDDDEYNDR